MEQTRGVEAAPRGGAESKGSSRLQGDGGFAPRGGVGPGSGAVSKVVEQVVGDGSGCKRWSRVGGAGYKGRSRLLGLETTSVGADYGG